MPWGIIVRSFFKCCIINGTDETGDDVIFEEDFADDK